MWDRYVITDWIDQHREPTVCPKIMTSTSAGQPIDSGFLAQALGTDTASSK